MGTSVELCRTTEGDVIVDNNGNVIISGIYDANKFDRGKDGVIISFMTNDNEYSYINLSGLFFDKYSYEQYDMVCHILGGAAYKVKKDGKYGLTNEFRTLNCVFDEVTFLNSNTFICGDIIRLRRGSKYLLVHARREYDACAEYDYIYTPLQPLDKFIVCQDGKYGFIDSDTFEEIIEPTFYSIEDLCCQYNFDVSKYTKNLYVTDEKLKLVNKTNMTSSFADSYFVDANKLLNGKWGGKDELIVDYETGETYVYKLLIVR